MTVTKKRFLPESEIQALLVLDRSAIVEKLAKMGTDGVAGLLERMQASYMIAARVANAGWAFYQESNRGWVAPETVEQMQATLRDYSPANFPLHGGELEVLCDELEDLRNNMRGMTAEECRELVEQRHAQYLHALRAAQESAPEIPRTPV